MSIKKQAAKDGSSSSLPKVVNLSRAFDTFSEHWSPRIAGELNGQQVKLAKLKGEFVWHHHDHEDELFLVISGELIIEFEQGSIQLNPGEFCIIPRGIEHKPVARDEVEVMLFEPATTLNTGQVKNEFTRDSLNHI
ncbi:MAG: cupin domain-containing protein [Flavobacteriales bacterium]|nr:cupin domain-containing protein [Bacteroidota bacterium]MCB9240888.1 cupin domain-containing protein [Flavobacteriales bacterium]